MAPSPLEMIPKEKIISIGNFKVGKSLLVENIALVDGLKHNLLSISQLCDKGLNLYSMILIMMLSTRNNSRVLFSFVKTMFMSLIS